MKLPNIIPPCNHNIPIFEEIIEYLPEPIAKQLRELIKTYNVIELEHLGVDESFDKCGYVYSTIYELGINKKYRVDQEYNLKILAEHKETKEIFIKLFKV